MRSRGFDVHSIWGQAHVLVSGDGPAVVMVNGIGTPAAMWAPLMAELDGFRLLAVDLPAYGLTDAAAELADNLRRNAVRVSFARARCGDAGVAMRTSGLPPETDVSPAHR